MQLVVEEKYLNKIIAYLSKRPFEEVAAIMYEFNANVKPLVKEEPNAEGDKDVT